MKHTPLFSAMSSITLLGVWIIGIFSALFMPSPESWTLLASTIIMTLIKILLQSRHPSITHLTVSCSTLSIGVAISGFVMSWIIGFPIILLGGAGLLWGVNRPKSLPAFGFALGGVISLSWGLLCLTGNLYEPLLHYFRQQSPSLWALNGLSFQVLVTWVGSAWLLTKSTQPSLTFRQAMKDPVFWVVAASFPLTALLYILLAFAGCPLSA